MFDKALIEKFNKIPTPFYYYDVHLLKDTLEKALQSASQYDYLIHYAIKANANSRVLEIARDMGFGADCVSGNEVSKAVSAGFDTGGIVYAGVGKADHEINIALDNDIMCFNCESGAELQVINRIAKDRNKKARVSLRINPNLPAHTHHYITTGLEENKFGIYLWELENILDLLDGLKNIELIGLHFHLGSQITDLNIFRGLCIRVNEIQKWFISRKIIVDHINVGGGLGVDYENPDTNSIPDFNTFFMLFHELLDLRPKQKLHFELGRCLTAHCGSLITKVLYIKRGVKTSFAIVDAGMTELIRPALYQSYHKIENITSNGSTKKYDVVGPICESSDCFGKAVALPETKRGDLIAIRSTGAYGEVMTSQYNLRDKVKAYYSDEMDY